MVKPVSPLPPDKSGTEKEEIQFQSVESEKNLKEENIVKNSMSSRMKKILVGIGVFGVLLSIALGISALVISLQDKDDDKTETPETPLEKYGTYEANIQRLSKLAELDSSTYKVIDLAENIQTRSSEKSENRKLEAIEIVPNYVIGGSNPFIIILCGLRANDFESVRACMELAESDLPTKWPGMNFIIAPISNPHGYDYALQKDQNWTKNRDDHGNGCFGTKISQNFENNFAVVTDDPCSEDFAGIEALSTWEAEAIHSYIFQYNWEALLVVESSSLSNLQVITPAKENSHAFRKLLPRVFLGAEGFETKRPEDSRTGFLEDSFISKFGRIATVQISKEETGNHRDLRLLVNNFSEQILKKNSFEKVFLDGFFWQEDNIFKYELVSTDSSSDQITTYEYNMTSLQWLDDSVTDRYLWTHSVYLIIPKEIKDDKAMFLQVTWGDNWIQPQTRASHSDDLSRTQQFAINTGIVSGVIKHVPNQPIRFRDDSETDKVIYGNDDGSYDGRYEDGILARTWDMFIKNFDATGESDYNLLVHPSMGKSTVRALDLMAEETYVHTGKYPFKAGVVGASKRGWTCWLAAAGDFERIKMNAPVVFDLLSSEASMEHLYKSLGGWTYAFFDYWYHKVTRNFGSDGLRASLKVLDPLEYKDRYAENIVTYVVNAANDEFFSLTGPLNYWEKLGGKKLLRILPDQPHGGVWGGWDREEENIGRKITRTKISDVGDMAEIQQDRLWTSLEALFPAVLSAPESIPSIDTNFNEFAGEMKLTAKSSLAPEAVRTYSRNTFNNKRDWRMRFYNGSEICDLSQIGDLQIQIDETTFDRVEGIPDREQVLTLSSTEENIWHSGFIDFEFLLDGRKFVASSLPGVTPSDKWASEVCTTPDECEGCLV